MDQVTVSVLGSEIKYVDPKTDNVETKLLPYRKRIKEVRELFPQYHIISLHFNEQIFDVDYEELTKKGDLKHCSTNKTKYL